MSHSTEKQLFTWTRRDPSLLLVRQIRERTVRETKEGSFYIYISSERVFVIFGGN